MDGVICEGAAFRLRPVRVQDAAFVAEMRRDDDVRNRYIHASPPDLAAQKEWIKAHLSKTDDYYFVIEDVLTGSADGLIGLYDVQSGRAEWGRWIVRHGSLAAMESVDLLCRIAFEQLGLDEIYSRTLADNQAVVSFHDALPAQRRAVAAPDVMLHGQAHAVIEHVITAAHYRDVLQPKLAGMAAALFRRNLSQFWGKMAFHHIGVATMSIEKDYAAYKLLGYQREGVAFEDPGQGIRGQFLTAPGQPRIELLENLVGSHMLDPWLANRTKMYHTAYQITAFDRITAALQRNRIKMLSAPKYSVYFKTRICFLVMPNLHMIELIEAPHDG